MSAPQAAAIAVILLLSLGIVLAATMLRNLTLEPKQKRMLSYAIVFSVLAKIALATRGHNFDVSSYCIVSNILEQGKSVYANTDRYNYGPIWAWLLSGFGHLAKCGAGEQFHEWIAAFLAIVDVMIGLVLARAYSWVAALVFLLSPISLQMSGFHSQFDNLAVLLALLAWLMIRKGNAQPAVLLGSSAVMGISLVVKHITFLFPIWLLFWKPLGKLRYRVLYAGLAYGIFGAAFLPWWGDPASRAGIIQHVFRYKSVYGNSLGGRVVGLFVPLDSFDAFFLRWFHVHSGLQMLWLGIMLATGIVLAIKDKRELFLLYLMTLYVSSPALEWQYTAIPMVAAAVFCELWESWAFLGAGTLALMFTKNNFFCPFAGYLIFHNIAGQDMLHAAAKITMLDETAGRMFLDASQLCIGALLLNRWLESRSPGALLSTRGKLVRATALVAAGCLPVALTLAKGAMHFDH